MIEGHEKQIDFFRKAISCDRLSHAYILAGKEGVGKKLFATYAAKALVCEDGKFFEDCSCQQCKSVDMGSNPDVYLYSPDELNVENMRKISESAAMTPLSAKWKVFILDGCEVFSTSQIVAGNALLKTLEEPGENSVFFLTASRYDMILPTIASRSNLISFSGLNVGEVKKVLQIIRPDVGWTDRVALKSGGSIAKALKILDGDVLKSVDFLDAGDYKRFAETFLIIKDKQSLRIIAELVYAKTLEDYKKSHGEHRFYLLGEYMLEILRRLSYNVNLDLLKAEFLAKTIETNKRTA